MKQKTFTIWPFKTKKTFDEWLDISTRNFRGYLSMLKDFNRDMTILLKIYESTSDKMIQQSIKGLPKTEYVKLRKVLKRVPEMFRKENVDYSSISTLSENSTIIALKQIKQIAGLLAYPQFIRDMSLVNLVSMFEDFLAKSLEAIFISHPQLLLSSGKQMRFGDVIKFTDINNLRDYVIKQELDDLLREEIEEIDDYLQKRVNIRLSVRKDWKQFKEIFHRRNLVVHSNSRVNNLYRIKTGYKGTKTVLTIDYDYLMSTIGVMKDYSEYIRDALLKQYVKRST